MQRQSKWALDMAAGHVIAWGRVGLVDPLVPWQVREVCVWAGHLTHEDL